MKDIHLFNSRSYKKESKGNQIKDEVNGVWFKADYLGYEAAAEYAVSRLLKGISVDHVDYEMCYEVFGNNKMLCCKSLDFLEEGQDVITLHRKLMQSVEAKPFSDTFDEQLDAAEELYGTPIKFRCKDLIAECGDEILKYYDKETVDRIDFVFRETRRKYKYLFG